MPNDAVPPKPTAEGAFAKTPLSHLLVYGYDKKLNGSMVFQAPNGKSGTVLFRGGHPVRAKISEPLYLSTVLEETMNLPATAFETSLRTRAESTRLHGDILVEMGLLTLADLTVALKEQLLRKMLFLFSLPAETTFAFYDGHDALVGFGSEQPKALVDPPRLLWAGIKKESAPDRVNQAIAKTGTNALRLLASAQINRFEFSKDEVAFIDLLRARPIRATDLAATGILPAAHAQRLIYCLLLTKQVDLTEAPLKAPSISPQAFARVQIQQRAASVPPIQERPSITSPGDSRIASPFPGTKAPVPSTPPIIPRRNSSAERDLKIIEAQRKKIMETVEALPDQNLFQVLGLEPSASTEEIQKAYVALAKIWHPDRLPAALTDVKAACATVFARLSEAHHTLTDRMRRAEYEKRMAGGAASDAEKAEIVSVLEAATNFQKAEVFLRKNDLAQCEEYVRKAVQGDPTQANYLALLAWVEALRPENQTKEATEAKIRMLDKAISLSEMCERAFFYRGLLHKRLDRAQHAMRDFKTAVDLNPRNLDAAREVRLYNMRTGAQKTAKASSPPKSAPRTSQAPGGTSMRPGKPTSDRPGNSFLDRLFKK